MDPVLGDRGVVAQVGFVDAFDKGYVEACGIGFGRIAHCAAISPQRLYPLWNNQKLLRYPKVREQVCIIQGFMS